MSELPQMIISQDLSGVGQVSLGVALPIVAALGVVPNALPTAYLSTHTGFAGNTYHDLSPDMTAALEHWSKLDLRPDGVYLGYLGRAAMPVWREWLPKFTGAMRLVDPVMGDNGKLYRGFDADYVAGMRELVQAAQTVTPNVTEAAFLLGEDVPGGEITPDTARGLATRVAQRFNIDVVLTGVPLRGGKVGVAGLQAGSVSWVLEQNRHPGQYFGTGDMFASVLAASRLRGLELQEASKLAMAFIDQAIANTLTAGSTGRWGVHYQAALPLLYNALAE